MTPIEPETNHGKTIRELGDGLILRHGMPKDKEQLAEFNSSVNSTSSYPDKSIYHWTLDMMSGDLPNIGPSDFTIVEDQNTRRIVSTLNLISQTWQYAGIKLGAGRIELVGTHPDYRRKGLVRAQMEVAHQWSAQRGEHIMGITGIPWYYRQFGYEMALDHLGGRAGYPLNVPTLPENVKEEYSIRPANSEDIPFLTKTYQAATQRYLVSCVRDESIWHYELYSRSKNSPHRYEIRVIESTRQQPVGLLVHSEPTQDGSISMQVYELVRGESWLAVTPAVIRYLKAYVDATIDSHMTSFQFDLGRLHPAFQVAKTWLPSKNSPYSWYMRVPNIPDFISHIGPVLEHRLEDSVAAGYTGDLKLNFVGNGLKLTFIGGRLASSESWKPTQLDSRLGAIERDALFPSLTFLQLLFGFRNLAELEYAYPDLRISSDKSREILNALFPKQVSRVWGIE